MLTETCQAFLTCTDIAQASVLCSAVLSDPFPDLSQGGSRVRAEGPVRHRGMAEASNSRVLAKQTRNVNNSKGLEWSLYLELSCNYF